MRHSIFRNAVRVLGIAGMVVLGLQGCATATDRDGVVAFPDPGDAWIEEGTYVNLENLRKMQMGVSKDQVYDLLGRPHFSEGLFNVHEWNYTFHLPTGEGDYRTCQYQVQFDDDMLANGLHWRDTDCAALLDVPKEPERMTLSADTLFEFDSSELSHEGRRAISNLAQRIGETFSTPDIVVMGYTDRLGKDAYNLRLSERRAIEVRAALIDQGVAANAVRSVGFGERNPLVQCSGSRASPQLKACLKPNRRVEVEVTEYPDN